MKYRIVTAENAEALTKAVAELLGQGWEPAGGVAVSCWYVQQEDVREGHMNGWTEYMLCQAMVLRPEREAWQR